MDSATHAQHEHAGHEHGGHDHGHHHHELPTGGRELDSMALSATLHCLTGCAIGEVVGMVVATALDLENLPSVLLAVAFAFLFGYTLTSLPLLRAGLAFGVVAPIAFASDTLSIGTMEVVDNLIVVLIPGAMDATLGELLFWGSLAFALVIAGAFAFPVNRWLLARGKGHAAVHETGIHGGLPPQVVGLLAALAFGFGGAVLLDQAIDDGGGGMGGHGGGGDAAEDVRGLAVASDGMKLELAPVELRRGRPGVLSFRIVGDGGRPMRDFEVEHTKRMHLIVVRRDMAGFQHLHPTLRPDGTWTAPVTLREPGSYRVFADFKRDGENHTLATDVDVDGPVAWRAMPPPSAVARTAGGYEVRAVAPASKAGEESELDFEVTRGGSRVAVEPYLGAGGHLVALREGDMAYLHVHPEGGARSTRFMTTFPTAGRYRLFLQFRAGGRVHTAEWTRVVG